MVLLATLTKSVKISLSEDQYNNLRKLANEQNESVSALIREMLENLLLQKKLLMKNQSADYVTMKLMVYGRDDMADSLEWVRKQRESWKDRLFKGEQ
jgi:predicted CopG family antitoxin